MNYLIPDNFSQLYSWINQVIMSELIPSQIHKILKLILVKTLEIQTVSSCLAAEPGKLF